MRTDSRNRWTLRMGRLVIKTGMKTEYTVARKYAASEST